jgi:hypothetical protein
VRNGRDPSAEVIAAHRADQNLTTRRETVRSSHCRGSWNRARGTGPDRVVRRRFSTSNCSGIRDGNLSWPDYLCSRTMTAAPQRGGTRGQITVPPGARYDHSGQGYWCENEAAPLVSAAVKRVTGPCIACSDAKCLGSSHGCYTHIPPRRHRSPVLWCGACD